MPWEGPVRLRGVVRAFPWTLWRVVFFYHRGSRLNVLRVLTGLSDLRSAGSQLSDTGEVFYYNSQANAGKEKG